MNPRSRALLESAIAAAQSAGRCIHSARDARQVDRKADASPVTQADRDADEVLRSVLLAASDAAWLSEETADSPERLSARRVWIVDPLDGTKEFITGVPEYAVAVALVEDGEPVLGVVHNPVTGETFWAERGGGAVLNGQPIHVAEGRVVLASRSETKRGEFTPFEDWEVRPVGSIQYKLALVAAGQGAVTWSRGPKHEWDVCAVYWPARRRRTRGHSARSPRSARPTGWRSWMGDNRTDGDGQDGHNRTDGGPLAHCGF